MCEKVGIGNTLKACADRIGGGLTNVYLCVTDDGYCHAVFDNWHAAVRFCNAHPAYHVIDRPVNKHESEVW